MMATQDVIARSATTTERPSIREIGEVAKLIDTSSASAARPARWRVRNGTTCATRSAPATDLRQPDRPHRRILTVMKFAEYENPGSGNLEWLIRKDGCMHCADPGCLKACPAPGRS